MGEFERSIAETVKVYIAGIHGQPLPKTFLIRQADARRIYSAGYERGWDALAEIKVEPAYFVAM